MNMKKLVTGALVATTLCMTTSLAPAYAGTSTRSSSATLMSASNLRVTLDSLLGEHANLAILAMESGYSGAPSFNALASALAANTKSLTGAITAVYGADAGAAFNKIWTAHIGFFVNYVEATAKQDKNGQQQALHDLAGYKRQFAEFLASANPNLKATTLEDGLQMHIDELITAFNDYVNKDYTGAAHEQVAAYNHMYMTGDLLSAAILKQFPSKFSNNKEFNSPATDLRVTLDSLLGEHASLAVQAMADGYTGAPDFTAVAGVLSTNTDQLTAAIQSVYGASAASVFNKVWSDHIGYFVDYVKATASQDTAGQQTALNHLAQYKHDFAEFLAAANPNLQASALEHGLQVHINELVGAFNDAVNGSWTDWAVGLVDSYNHMIMTGDALSGAIAAQFSLEMDPSMYSSWPQIRLYVNGKDTSNPLSWLSTDSNTGMGSPWVPIWYVMHVLKGLGVQSTWDGSHWDITLPSGWTAPTMNEGGSGSTTVSVNGTTLWLVHSTVTADPYSKVPTTYMSDSDLNTLFAALNLKSSWNGINWYISK